MSPCQAASEDARSHHILVSVSPHKFFVEAIAGDTVTIGVVVPAGSSSHTFEPTPKQMLAASKADLWFQIGEFFEGRATRALKSHNKRMLFIDLRQGLDLISAGNGDDDGCSHCAHHGSGMDLHIWMSPRLAKTQAQTIAQALIAMYPEHQERYTASLNKFIEELDALDQDITQMLQGLKQRIVMVSHPAYAYFCRDYNLKQLSIEFEGKDPTAQQLTKILQQARDAHISVIFIQLQYNSKGARLMAKELGAQIVILDPYSEDYLATMRNIARHFADQ